MKYQLAAWRRRVDGFGRALEADPLPLQLAHQLDQVLERPAQPVETPDHQHIALPQQLRGPLQPVTLHLAAAGRVLDDLAAPCHLESVALQVGILLAGRYPCIADFHASTCFWPVGLRNPSQSSEDLP